MTEVDSETADAPADRIERLEERIDALSEAIGRSRRLALVGRICAGAGPVLLAGLALGALEFTPVRMMLGIALGLGGLILIGSSKTSTEQLVAALKSAQSERNAAIDGLEFIRPGGGGA